jgi:hypothetical protein
MIRGKHGLILADGKGYLIAVGTDLQNFCEGSLHFIKILREESGSRTLSVFWGWGSPIPESLQQAPCQQLLGQPHRADRLIIRRR